MFYEKVFESDRIIFIKLNYQLKDEYLKMYNDKNIQKSLFKKIYDKKTILKWIKMILKEDSYKYSMLSKETKDFIGNIEIIPNEENTAEIMISITPEKQGNHFATEAIKAIIEFGNKNLGIKGYDLNVYKSNKKAINIYQKVGFKEDGNNLSDEYIHMKL